MKGFIASALQHVARVFRARHRRCWAKVGVFSGEVYCGVHGRAAGWPCLPDYPSSVVQVGVHPNGAPLRMNLSTYTEADLTRLHATLMERNITVWSRPAAGPHVEYVIGKSAVPSWLTS